MTRNRRKGFTLVELLVVIAVIGMLSSIVLASLNGARIKANNAARLQKVHQWINALELYRSNDSNGKYPTVGSPACLVGTSGVCKLTGSGFNTSLTNLTYDGTIKGDNTQSTPGPDTTFNNSMTNYIKNTDASDVDLTGTVSGNTVEIQGVLYRGSGGTSYDIYYGQQNGTACPIGKNAQLNIGGSGGSNTDIPFICRFSSTTL